ncbi:dienelactone hydrolase family protein [Desulfovibrio sp. TomC]|uniref:dienelactone hydrolase family protein n=1 Tax=Desulfovibrio sp. TomC TaxID=1562888 RepID=UPI000573E162|nr:dienelactone hydrolase family protein [Desulfovibrio sp. TomC]KHK04069.1 Dienelactone hydrolase family [Desulfovibrio sp. TomC]
MKTFIVSDIYGLTPVVEAFAGQLDRQAVVLSPWDGEGCPFATEQEAHAAFVAGEGVAGFAARVTAAAGGEPAFLVGFSAGATAVWLHAAGAGCHPDSRAVLFYGSRIRNHLDARPRCRVQAIFAEVEAAFDPKTIIARMASENVAVHIGPGAAHGFMNPLSPGYCEDFFRKYREMVRQQYVGWTRRHGAG